MTLEIKIPKPGEAEVGGLTADRRLCLSQDDRLVEAGSLESVVLLAGEGSLIPGDVVTRFRLELKDGRVVQRSSEPAAVESAPHPAVLGSEVSNTFHPTDPPAPPLGEPVNAVTEELLADDAKVAPKRKR